MLLLQSKKINWPVGETVNSHAFHACIHGFESRTGYHIGAWFNGRASVSKTVDAGSIPAAPAIKQVGAIDRSFFLFKYIIYDKSDSSLR